MTCFEKSDLTTAVHALFFPVLGPLVSTPPPPLEHLVNTGNSIVNAVSARHCTDLTSDSQVDCGGNVGHFTMFAAARHLRVTTFEMQPNLFVLLEMSVRASGYSSHVKIHNAPLWETDGEVGLRNTGTVLLTRHALHGAPSSCCCAP